MNTQVPEYSELRLVPSLLSFPIETAMKMAAHLVDEACERRSVNDLERALELISELQSSTSNVAHIANLYYFTANAWGGLRLIRSQDQESQCRWQQPEMGHELLALRQARNSDGFALLLPGRRTQILTNTGNILSTIGRFLEAIRLYDEALAVFPSFGMAMANQGIALKQLARLHYDPGQACLLLHRAWCDFRDAPPKDLQPGVEKSIRRHAKEIESWLDREFLEQSVSEPLDSLGKSKAEQRYRLWASNEQLFLNPLIVLGTDEYGARDTLCLPNIVLDWNEGPGLIGMFSQIKQEFITARLLAWEGITAERPHFADRQTYIVDTYDYAVYGVALEKTKVAYRMAYSVLDKCAFLLNKYLELGIPDNVVNLNLVWFTKGKPNKKKPDKGLNQEVMNKPNWPLRGLFWLARDLYDREAFVDALEPNARELKEIRDHLEHKYLKIHGLALPGEGTPDGIRDQYAKSIKLDSMEAKTVTLLRLARSALIYLSLGIHAEERKRASEREPEAIIPPMHLSLVPDDWKR